MTASAFERVRRLLMLMALASGLALAGGAVLSQVPSPTLNYIPDIERNSFPLFTNPTLLFSTANGKAWIVDSFYQVAEGFGICAFLSLFSFKVTKRERIVPLGLRVVGLDLIAIGLLTFGWALTVNTSYPSAYFYSSTLWLTAYLFHIGLGYHFGGVLGIVGAIGAIIACIGYFIFRLNNGWRASALSTVLNLFAPLAVANSLLVLGWITIDMTAHITNFLPWGWAEIPFVPSPQPISYISNWTVMVVAVYLTVRGLRLPKFIQPFSRHSTAIPAERPASGKDV